MPTAVKAGSTNVTATAAHTVSSPTFTLSGGGVRKAIVVAIAHSGGLGDSPVTSVTYGADSGFFLAAQVDTLSAATVEFWIIFPVTATSDVITVNFDVSVSVTVLFYAEEVTEYGAQGPDASTPGGNGLLGTTYSVNITVSDSTGGRKQTVSVPSTQGLVVGCAASAHTTATVAPASGTSVHTAVAGSGANRIAFAVLNLQATGGSDSISFTNSTSAPYAILGMACLGTSIPGALCAASVIPSSF